MRVIERPDEVPQESVIPIQKTGKESKSKNVADYVKTNAKVHLIPKDQYAHSYLLLDSERPDFHKTDEYLNPTSIVDKHVQLCNVGDDTLLRLYQNDVIIFTQLQDLARRDSAMSMFYRVVSQAWRSELLLTKTKNGEERKLQATASSPKYVPNERLYGYGEGLGLGPEEEQEGIINKILNKKRD